MSPKKTDKEPTTAAAGNRPQPEKPVKNPDILLQMLPIIFHKLKNKLTPILGYAQILKSASENEFQTTRLQKIENGALDFTDLLNKLKDYFTVAKGQKQKLNLDAIVQSQVPELRRRTDDLDIALHIDLAGTLPDSLFYAEEIRALLGELVDNACLALQNKGSRDKAITISSQRDGEGFTLKIRDNGPGISLEAQDKIWTPFYTTNPGRAGLGLVLCEKIIANHGGCPRIDSIVGDYCEFAISFPVEA